MTSTTTIPPQTVRSQPTALQRVGYSFAVLGNALGLWIVHHLLDWGWPDFLTASFSEVLPLLSASMIAGILVNAALMQTNRPAFRAFTELVTAGFGLAVTMRFWSVFPFDFTGYETDWSWVVRIVLVVGFVGSGISILVNLFKMIGLVSVDD